MTEIRPYSRRVRLLVYPLEEWRGGGDESLAITLEGDGTQDNFRIKFDVHLHIASTATPTVIEIYNLSQGLRDELIQKREAKVALWVGWDNIGLTLLYSGTLLAVINQRQGADIVTSLMTNSAMGAMSRAATSETFASGSTVKSVIEYLARKLEGVTVDIKNIRVDETKKFGTQGKSLVGLVRDSLNELARTYGFSWSVDKGVFYAVTDGEAISSQQVVISSDSGLLRVEPMLSGPWQVKTGTTITCLLNPWITLWGIVVVRSTMNPQIENNKRVDQKFVVHELSHSGDTHSMTWESRIESLVYGVT